jgi:general secretion pathway protein H
MARTRTSAPGNSRAGARGFTLIELLIVVALIAIASGLASLALRDPSTAQLEQEAVRLSALLEAARAEARASGLAVRWQTLDAEARAGNNNDGAGVDGFRFVGLPGREAEPMHWLHQGVSAQVIGASAVQLGPEPVIAPQRILLRLDDRQLVLATDGLAPFAVVQDAGAEPAR